MAAGFFAGFAQGWEAESERIERRKLFMEEQKAGRVNTLAELISRRGGSASRSGGGSGGGEADSPNSADHNMQVLQNYGYTPEQIAKLNAKGPYALQAAVATTQEVAKNKAAITPTLFDSISDSIVVTVDAGEEVDPKEFAAQLYGEDFAESMSPEDAAYLGALGSATPTAQVTSTFVPEEPYDVAKANQVINAANEALKGTLSEKRSEFTRMATDQTLDQNDRTLAAEQAAQIGIAMDELETGNAMPGIRLVGAEIIQPYLDQDPELRNAPPGILGNWGMVIGQEEEAAPQEDPAQQGPQVGDVIQGYRFLGGDPGDENSWEYVGG